MADLKISQLSDGGASQATDEYVVARSGSNFRIDGASVAAAATSVGTLTSLTVSGNITASGGTANGIGYLNASKVFTAGSDLTYNGTKVVLATNGSFESAFSGNGLVVSKTNVGAVNAIRSVADTSNILLINDSASGFDNVDIYTAGSQRLRIDGSGNLAVDTNTLYVDAANNRVGVGTASPTDTLTVGAFSGNNVLTIGAGTSGSSALYFGDGTGADRYRGAIDYSHSTDRFEFGTAATVKMYLDASGNLGLGVTPSAWTTLRAFQSQRSAFASYSDGSPNAATYVIANAFYDGSWKYIASIGAALYEQGTSSGGTHVWSVAPSGTAGNAISFTTAMTLNASGKLGVGTASPTEKLHVASGRILVSGATVASEFSNNTIRITGNQSVADDATLSASVANATLIYVAENDAGDGVLFFATYASGTVIKVADPSNIGAVSDTDGKLCVYKNVTSGIVTIKNRLGATKSLTVGMYSVTD